jgi:hypothetical protein
MATPTSLSSTDYSKLDLFPKVADVCEAKSTDWCCQQAIIRRGAFEKLSQACDTPVICSANGSIHPKAVVLEMKTADSSNRLAPRLPGIRPACWSLLVPVRMQRHEVAHMHGDRVGDDAMQRVPHVSA